MKIDEFIAEQPEILEEVLAEVPGQLAALGPIHAARPIYLVGSGKSRNALAAVAPLLGRLVPAGVRVRGPLAFLAETAGAHKGKGIAIFLSQTGTTSTTVQAVSHAASLGWRTLAFTADRRSPIGRASGEIVVIPVGREPVGPKTKGYTASLLALILLAGAVAGHDVRPADFTTELSWLIAYARGVAAELAEMREGCGYFMVLGQERHYATALEGSLKISEMSGVAATAFDTEEAFHGRFHGLSSFSAALFVAGTAAQYDMAATGATVLYGEQPVARRRRPHGLAAVYDEPVRGERGRVRPDARGRQLAPEVDAADARGIHSEGDGGGGVGEAHPRERRIKAEPGDPPRGEPRRMRPRHAQEGDLIILVRPRQPAPIAAETAEDRVDGTGRPRVAVGATQADRIVNNSRCRHAIEMEQLVRREPQDVQYAAVECWDRSLAGPGDGVVERPAPPQGADDDLGRKRPVSLVREIAAAPFQLRLARKGAGSGADRYRVRR